MADVDQLSVEEWKTLFSSIDRADLMRLRDIIDRVEAGQGFSAEDRRAILGIFSAKAALATDAA
jgi:hypothetical protein